MELFQELGSLFTRPEPYAEMKAPFWDDEYISLQMLQAHLDPEFDGASRNLDFVERSVAWINRILPPEEYRSIIDFGCGPGIYTERFAQQGYEVTGVDLSRRSIRYAEKSADEKHLPVKYICRNYLNLDLDREFDLAMLIYCDYGVLPPASRNQLLKTIHRHLRPGGKLLLDVCTLAALEKFEESRTWEVCSESGFWSAEPYIAINGNYRYPGNVTLRQTLVVTEKAAQNYYLWDTYFSKEALEKEALDCGFRVSGFFADVSGAVYQEDSPTLAVVLEK